eukprot:6478573-Amphidinium_carterae.1
MQSWRQGRRLFGREATGSGGVAIAVAKHIGAVEVERWKEVPESRAVGVRVQSILPQGVLLASIYLRTAVMPRQQMDLLGEIGQCVLEENTAWILGGDWNMQPHELRATGFLDLVQGVVVRVQQPTCHAGAHRELDYFVLSKGAAQMVQALHVHPLTLTRPHDTLLLTMSTQSLLERVPVAVHYPAEVITQPIGPWRPERAHDWAWQAGELPAHLGAGFQEWVGEVEQWRTQFGVRPRVERGRGHR